MARIASRVFCRTPASFSPSSSRSFSTMGFLICSINEGCDRRRHPLAPGPSAKTDCSLGKGEPAGRRPVPRSVLPLFIYFGAEGKPLSAAQPNNLLAPKNVCTQKTAYFFVCGQQGRCTPSHLGQKRMSPSRGPELEKNRSRASHSDLIAHHFFMGGA